MPPFPLSFILVYMHGMATISRVMVTAVAVLYVTVSSLAHIALVRRSFVTGHSKTVPHCVRFRIVQKYALPVSIRIDLKILSVFMLFSLNSVAKWSGRWHCGLVLPTL